MLLLGLFPQTSRGSHYFEPFKALVAIGLVSWIACPVLAVLGYQRLDPSYLWFPATVAIFLLFSRMEFRGKRNSVAISFLARHSYAVYLLQCTTIDFVYGHIGKDLITLASMFRMPVALHNIDDKDIYRPHAWSAFGTKDLEGADYRACAHYKELYK